MLKTKWVVGAVAAMALAVGSRSFAEPDEQSKLEQITVLGLKSNEESGVGTKTDTPLVEVPQSISVIGADQMDLQGAQSLGQALGYTAGVNPDQYGLVDSRIDWFMVRGFPSSSPYIDGLSDVSRYTLMSPKVDPYGLDRLEILRGPSSVLYGQNVPGGLINAVSKRPQDEESGELAVQGGSWGRAEIRGDITGPLTDDHSLLYRLTGLVLDTGTQVEHVQDHHYFLAPALSWIPDESTAITFLSHILRQQDGFALQNLPAAGTLYPSSYGRVSTSLFTGEPSLNFATLTQWDVGYNAEHRFSSNWTVHQNLRFMHSELGLGYVAGYGQDADDPAVMDRFALQAQAHQNNFAVDTNAEGKFTTAGIDHTLLVGVDHTRSHDFWDEDDGSASSLNLSDPVYGGPISLVNDYVTDDTLHQTGVYAQDQMKVDSVVLTGSIRHDWALTDTKDVLGSTEIRQNDSALTGRGGAVYLFDNGLAPYMSYSTSFQPTVGTTYSGDPLLPTTAKQWEAGLKYQPKGTQSFAMLSAYTLDEHNVTTPDPNPEHPNQVVQTGAARVQGVELSSNLELAYGLSSTLAYTYMSSKITSATDDSLGKQLMDVAHHSASAWLNKKFDLPDDQHLILGAGVRYIGSRFGDDANTLLLSDSTQFDVMARYQIARWQLTLNVMNLTDRIVVAQCDSTARCFYDQRRDILVTAAYRW